ncbi:MAG: HIT family protein [Flavobacteriales bacterium]
MASVFSKIISGEVSCYKIAEDKDHLAFLDIYPLEQGHVLVIPKKEVDNIFDLSADEYARLFAFSHQVGKAIEKAVPCVKVGIAVVGLEVPHAHVHLIPLQNVSDLDFTRPKKQYTAESFELIRQKIVAQL